MKEQDHKDVGNDDEKTRRRLNSQFSQQKANARDEERAARTKPKKLPKSAIYIGGASLAAKPFAIMRTEKLKSMVQVTNSKKHLMRLQDTPNAVPELTQFNQILIGSDDLTADVKAKIGSRKVRKNAVLVIDQILTASPEFFDKNPDPNHPLPWDPKQVDAWVAENLQYIKKQWGDNAVNVVLHLDETSPHLHVYVVPLDYSKDPNGRLSAKALIGGSKFRLSKMQDEYATAMSPFGLHRGVKKSKARHQSVRRYYRLIREMPRSYKLSPVHLPALQRPGAMLDPVGFAEEQIKLQTENMQRHIARIEAENRVLKEGREQDRSRVRAAADWQSAAEKVRDIDLDAVMQKLGAIQDKKWTTIYRVPGSDTCIQVDRARNAFKDSEAGHQGAGAISLVMHLHGCDFKSAVRLLSGKFGVDQAAAAATSHQYIENIKCAKDPLTFIPPAESPQHLEDVREHLVNTYKLPSPAVDQLIRDGDLYAEYRPGKNKNMVNAVIIVRDSDNKPVGAELLGVTANFKSLAPGSDISKGLFSIGPERPEKLAFVSSALEAISYQALHPTHKAVCVGPTPTVAQIEQVKKYFMYALDGFDGRLLCALPDTTQGNDAAECLDGAIEHRIRPGVDESRSVDNDGNRPKFETWSARLIRQKEVEEIEIKEIEKTLQLERKNEHFQEGEAVNFKV